MLPSSAFRPPRTFGSYDVHEPLGRGGMATVFRGEHRLLERQVAIKFLHSNLADRPRERQRFLREARLVAKLAHPNIVTVFDFGELDDGTYYQASELIAGATLRETLRGGALPVGRALRFARQIALGLASAHAVGIIHRDLKPSNVMVAPDATAPDELRLKILDFGIAKSVDVETGDRDGLTKTGIVIGTPGYMAPEQRAGATEIGPTADIYSLGIVLYAMLCGRRPFDGDTDDIVPPTGCGPELDALVASCLARAPADRPQSMVDVIAAIDALLGVPGEPVPSPRPSRPSPAPLEQHTAKLGSDAPLVRLAYVPEPSETEPTTTLDRAIVSTTTEPAPRRRRLVAAGALAAIAIAGIVAFAVTRGGGDQAAPQREEVAPRQTREEPREAPVVREEPAPPREAPVVREEPAPQREAPVVREEPAPIAVDHEPTSVRAAVPMPVVAKPTPRRDPPPPKPKPEDRTYERANY